MSKKTMLRLELENLAEVGIDGSSDVELLDMTHRQQDIYLWGVRNMPVKIMEAWIKEWKEEDEKNGRSL
jgi:hypothetical protein